MTLVDGRYSIRRPIAHGGSAGIFEAEQVFTGRVVALKMLSERAALQRDQKKRLKREAVVLSRLRHNNIITLFDAGEFDKLPYLVLEYVEGRPLAGILAARGSLPFSSVVWIGQRLCEALAEVHAAGIVHRDIKPSNVLITTSRRGQEQLKLIDFGIASRGQGDDPIAPKITTEFQFVGTPEYCPPEAFSALDNDHRRDVYSLGATLFECLTGQLPYAGVERHMLSKVMSEHPTDIRRIRSDIPDTLASVIHRALALEKNKRFPAIEDFHDALNMIKAPQNGPPLLMAYADVTPMLRPTFVESPYASRRKHKRAPFRTPVRMVLQDGTTVDGHSEDISEGGMLILLKTPAEIPSSAVIRFASPVTGHILTVKSSQRWLRTSHQGQAYGLQFESLPENTLSEIRTYIRLMGKVDLTDAAMEES